MKETPLNRKWKYEVRNGFEEVVERIRREGIGEARRGRPARLNNRSAR